MDIPATPDQPSSLEQFRRRIPVGEGDTEANDCFASVDNSQRRWAQKALAAVSSLPPWSWDDYVRARAFFQTQFPSKMAMWEHFARQPK